MKRTLLTIGIFIPLTACTGWLGNSNDTPNGGAASSRPSVSSSSSSQSSFSQLSDEEKSDAAALIDSRINTYVSTPPELGGQYYVTDIEWDSDNTAIVTYEDGHIQGRARATVIVVNGEIEIVQFVEFISE